MRLSVVIGARSGAVDIQERAAYRRRVSVYGLLLFASTLFFGVEVRLLTYIRSLFRASQHATLMGFRAPAPYCFIVLLRTWTFTGFADAGSTCSPSFRMLRNRGWKVSLSVHYGSWLPFPATQLVARSGW